MTATIGVVGSGLLADAVCRSLAACSSPFSVAVIGRNTMATAMICVRAGSIAGLAGNPMRFYPLTADLADPPSMQRALQFAVPAVLILCASYQSPWERSTAPSAWTTLLDGAGFGLSLPLQAAPAIVAGRELSAACPGAFFVNTCLPDLVNPVLVRSGVPVVCGAGNVSTLAAALGYELGAYDAATVDAARIKVVAHHAHLREPDDAVDEAWAWLDDERVPSVTASLAVLRASSRQSQVEIAGASAAQVARALASGGRIDTCVPGPLGFPGGYPVRIEDGKLSFRLPAGCTMADAIAFNERASAKDGIILDEDTIRFGDAAQERLSQELPGLADGFPVSDITSACDQLLRLRTRLRVQSPSEVAR
jgi:hypothetical protein